MKTAQKVTEYKINMQTILRSFIEEYRSYSFKITAAIFRKFTQKEGQTGNVESY